MNDPSPRDGDADRAVFRDLLFPTPVYRAAVAGAEGINARLKPLIYAWRERDPVGVVRTNEAGLGGWHGPTDMHRRAEFTAFAEEISAVMEGVFTSLGYDPQFGPACGSMWANISPRLASNRQHTHPSALWSGVYYVQTPPDCGDLYFTDPRAQALVNPPFHGEAHPPPLSGPEIPLTPVAGIALAFPAWLSHGVMPNLTDETGTAGDRISVSFNYHQLRRSAEGLP